MHNVAFYIHFVFQPKEGLVFNDQISVGHPYSRSVILEVTINKSMFLWSLNCMPNIKGKATPFSKCFEIVCWWRDYGVCHQTNKDLNGDSFTWRQIDRDILLLWASVSSLYSWYDKTVWRIEGNHVCKSLSLVSTQAGAQSAVSTHPFSLDLNFFVFIFIF